MLDRPLGPPDYPADTIRFQPGQRLLCLAPHPDDEILGAGGLLALAVRQGQRVCTIVVTDGDQGLDVPPAADPASDARLEESRRAAERLGLPLPQFWHLADRTLRYCPPLVVRITEALRAERPDWLLLPALSEPHPDHQALALAGMAALLDLDFDCTLLFYEVGAPTSPNVLVDISAVAEDKWRALACFASQEQRHPYLRHAQAMASLRAFGLGPQVAAAEAFWQLPAAELRRGGQAASLAPWPLQRQAWGGASQLAQLPLVSVIIRSMGRPALADAIASVAAQTYPNIEIVLVNALGRLHPSSDYPAQRLGLRLVQAGSDGLGRAQAANLGLREAAGELALFLDDDDLLLPQHLQRLVDALARRREAVAAYGGVRVEGARGEHLRDYDVPWSPERLAGINFLPIHAVLFRLDAVRAQSSGFDGDLPVLEDWDFWCQLARAGDFVHQPGVSAIYRQGQGTSELSNPQHTNHWRQWHRRILQQHIERWGEPHLLDALAWSALSLDQAELARDQAELAREHVERSAQEQDAQLRQELADLGARLQAVQAERDLAQASFHRLQQSRPVRWARALRELLGRPRSP